MARVPELEVAGRRDDGIEPFTVRVEGELGRGPGELVRPLQVEARISILLEEPAGG